MATNIENAQPNVKMIWLVTVNPYGIIPNKLQVKIKSKAKGIKWKIINHPPLENTNQEKLATIFKRIWLDIIFAKRRSESVITRRK